MQQSIDSFYQTSNIMSTQRSCSTMRSSQRGAADQFIFRQQKNLLKRANEKYDSAEKGDQFNTPRTYAKHIKSGLKKNSRFGKPYSRAALKMAFLVHDPENNGHVETSRC